MCSAVAVKGQGLTLGHLTVKTIRPKEKAGYNNVLEGKKTERSEGILTGFAPR